MSALSGANGIFYHGVISQQLTQHPIKAVLDDFSSDETFLVMQTHDFTIYNGKLNACPYYTLASKWSPAP